MSVSSFIDKAHIYVRAGKGGDGCRSYCRDRYHRYPIPNGGDGGDGGDVIIRADVHKVTLLDFQFKNIFSAKDGCHGSRNKKKGLKGAENIISVPPGTLIKDVSTGDLLRDLKKDREEVIVAKGGRGGIGNAKLKLPTTGEYGVDRKLELELRLIADIGIIGYPNAGKSSLISRISSARSKVAPYPFTTTSPVLGVVRIDEESVFTPLEKDFLTGFTVVDIPGLIEGAHRGKGLGFEFLRHAERTKALLHLIDMAAVDGRDPINDYHSLNEELKLYNPELLDKHQLIVANKMDLTSAIENLKRFKEGVKEKVYPISCISGEGIKELLGNIVRTLKNPFYTAKAQKFR